ncbi:serine hydrolase domain-containing protein [Natronocalculus amylovorans]|uniref:Beta-lactamase family protein n=1 Tax=Natronocalculus amylovorans TaxID=2917812 RepID=A0AAE3FXP5_9EURY|nr:serine hydrolase [Natronocalculus amylovorans]MCL9816948.1 beta-lactamase family protein [Natronocalculus amylovorans]
MDNPSPLDRSPLERASPTDMGIDPDAIADAIAFHKTHDTLAEQVAYDFSNLDPWDEAEGPYGRRLGPMPPRRGGPSGMILKDGDVIAEWGDIHRVDHTFSVAKSFLSLCAGIAFDRGLLPPLDEPVAETIQDGGFESEHNQQITWRHLLAQTSEWEGTLFDRPDTVDRNRAVGKTDALDKATTRTLEQPGTFWEYNDVRINRLSLALLRLFGKPLPRVLADEIMTPIGATEWEWHGYYNSRVDVNGQAMECVSGGGHWGGGLWISTDSLARVGMLLANGGVWNGNRILSESWIDLSTTPCNIYPGYGFLWWLNTDQTVWPAAPEASYAALGAGQNMLWIDPKDSLVVVLRWLRMHPDRAERSDNPNQAAFFERLFATS